MHKGIKYLTQSVERALNILEMLAGKKGGMGVTELSRSLNLRKPTVHRLLSTLRSKNFVQQDPRTEKYMLGWKILQMKSTIPEYADLKMAATPFMEKLVKESGQTCNLAVLDKNNAEIIYIKSIESDKLIRAGAANAGRRSPVYYTALGKILVAFLPDEEQKEVIGRIKFIRLSPYTITSAQKFRKEMEKIRKFQFALDDREGDEESRCIAGPVRNSTGEVIAAISISGSTQSITDERIPGLSKMVRKTAEKISCKLGYKN